MLRKVCCYMFGVKHFFVCGFGFNLVKSDVGCIRRGMVLFCLVLLLFCSVVVGGYSAGLVDAQHQSSAQSSSTITIMSDGRVKGTDLIYRDGDVYIFRGDIWGTIRVEKDDIVIDGAGYSIKGDGASGVVLNKFSADGEVMARYGGVVVRNVRFCDKSRIITSSKGNIFINNTFERGRIDVHQGIEKNGTGNIIKHNVFIDCLTAISTLYTNLDIISENNFFNCSLFLTFMSKQVVDGNYWSDYTALYPYAKEVGNTGVWDTPYNYTHPTYPGSLSFVDYNPLVSPLVGVGAPEINYTPTPVPSSSVVDREFVSLQTVLIVVSVVFVVVVSLGLLVYFRRHKQVLCSS